MRAVLRERFVNECHLDRSRSHAKRDEAQWRDPEGRSLTMPLCRLFGDAVGCENYDAKIPGRSACRRHGGASILGISPLRRRAAPAPVEMTHAGSFAGT